ncbi:tryptophan dimethylallyltransferase-domain-containing protein [Astrocystis sublimbata]|nr:tryptophan dimethylallyltransferase-domain-containing protein [Astrocystis sublimbata]
MSSLLGLFSDGQLPVTSYYYLSTLSTYLIPCFFALLALEALNIISGGWLPSVMKAIRSSRSTSTFKPHFNPNPVKIESKTHKNVIAPNPEALLELLIWNKVNARLAVENTHHRFWWERHTGRALAILLHAAEYPEHIQQRDLEFFATSVAPYLGISRETIKDQWPSFMTDDGTPLELSWDWGTKDGPPTIRYSVEPIGLTAGSSLDPGNLLAGPAFHQQLVRSLADMRLEWHQHFQDFFNGNDKAGFARDATDHNTSIFYAFDLSPTEVTAKTYYFPKIRAQAKGQSNLEVLSQAIRSAPLTTKKNLKAWDMFCDFTSDSSSKEIEYEMLAIDLIDPLESRLKIYFRCRETTFNSVINVMTIGGRVKNPKLRQGLEDLRLLWNALFDIDTNASPDASLPAVGHRTAGILYNVEFRLGEEHPVAKIYLPVRHYAKSDDAIIQALNTYFQHHKRGKYMPSYVKAMRKIFSQKSMEATSGIQTYVGCSIRPNGTLRVVSYFKPGIPEFSTSQRG